MFLNQKMNRVRHLNRRFLGVLVLLFTGICARAGTVVPVDLRCEHLVDPIGLDAVQPRLSWKLSATSESARGLKQRAYQILAASSPELLAANQGDLWDSGKKATDNSLDVSYGGKSLASREKVFWKVRVWDGGQPAEWSQPANWEMGLLQPADWRAKWIDAPIVPVVNTNVIIKTLKIVQAFYGPESDPHAKDVTEIVSQMVTNNQLSLIAANDVFKGDPALKKVKQLHVTYTLDEEKLETTIVENSPLNIPERRESLGYLRKDFALDKPVSSVRLYATALGLYEFHLNGQRIGDHFLAPDWTDYNKRVRYQVYDVTALVRSGSNTLGALVGNGWYAGHIGNGGFQAWGKVPALFAQLEATYTDGTVARIVTDASWKIHSGPALSSDFMLGENYDARMEIAGWDQPGLDVADWSATTERAEPSREFDSQVDEPVREIMVLHPKSMNEPKPGQWIYDFGQNMVGVARLKVSAPAGTKITLRHAEMLNADGTLYTKNLRGAPSVDTYVCKGGGEETWQPRFTFHGFRYLELTGVAQPPTADTITGIVISTALPRSGEFSCSNPDINQLQSNIQWGMRGNYLSVPTDCPQRDERMGWMGDAEVFVRTATYNGDVAAFFTKWLVDVDDAQHADGAFTDVSPSPFGNGHGNPGVPAWADAGVICPWTIYLMYGDRRILETHLPAMKRWVDWCQAHSTHLIRDRDRGPDYGDWLSQGEDTPKDLIGTAYFAYSTLLVANACKATGDTRGAAKYRHLFAEIRKAFNRRFVAAEGRIKGDTQCSYAMALKFNLLPDELRPKAAQYLADDIARHHDHLTTGFIGVSYLLPTLCSQNQSDTAYRVFFQDTFPSWLFSVKQGATTIWERWDGWTPEKGFQDPGMNSFNHYSLGSCGEWMFETVAGIEVDPDRPGFDHIIIKPVVSPNLTWVKASYNSVRGKIVSDWELQNKKFQIHVVIPPNTTATIHLPGRGGSSVLESGKPAAKARGVRVLRGHHGEQFFEVGSGTYDFTSTL